MNSYPFVRLKPLHGTPSRHSKAATARTSGTGSEYRVSIADPATNCSKWFRPSTPSATVLMIHPIQRARRTPWRERPDAKQQGKEEAEAGQEQEERRCHRLAVRRHAEPVQARHEPVRQEELGCAGTEPR